LAWGDADRAIYSDAVIDLTAMRLRWEQSAPFLDERGRRLFAANEAQREGAGGVTALSKATGLARSTINRGMRELRSGRNEIGSRVRRRGAGRKSAVTHQPGLPAALERMIEDAIRGDPCSPLRWISRSQRHLVKALSAQGFRVSQRVVANLLRELRYSCQANRKTREGGNHPDRDAQFAHINATVKAAIAAGEPAISVDTKKKELVGDFKNNGHELRRQGDPEPVRVHDFKIPELGKVAPYGVYDIAANHGWVSVGIDADTGAFAVESIRRWWHRLGQVRYPNAKRLTITADCGGSNGPQLRLWKRELQRFANQTGLTITVTHLPPGTSKWNRIEHRLFAFITMNWRGKPLVSHQVIVQLIGSTTTETGLKVCCEIDGNLYPKGIKVTDQEIQAINISRNEFHGEWNYSIAPNQQPP
jgi:Rhodopirellula transposase DDE domain